MTSFWYNSDLILTSKISKDVLIRNFVAIFQKIFYERSRRVNSRRDYENNAPE